MIKGKLIPRRLKRSRPAMRWPGLERGSSSRILATWPAPDPHQAAARAAQLPGSKADRSPGPAAAATGPGSHQSAAAGPGGPLLQLLPSGAAAPDPHQAAARAAQLPGSEAGRSPGPGAAATGPGSRQGPGAVPSWAPAAAAPLRPPAGPLLQLLPSGPAAPDPRAQDAQQRTRAQLLPGIRARQLFQDPGHRPAPDPRAQDAQQRTRAHRAPGIRARQLPRILATWPAPDPSQAAARAAQLPAAKPIDHPGPERQPPAQELNPVSKPFQPSLTTRFNSRKSRAALYKM